MKQNLSRGEKKLIAASLLAIGIIGGGFGARSYLNRDSIANIPPRPALPKPNGFDLYVQAAQSIVPANPAVDEINDANPPKDAKIRTQQYSLARKEAWLKQNAAAFSLFQTALRTPCLHPSERSAETSLPAGKWLRELARSKAIEAKAREMRGDWNGAMQSRIDTTQMGNDVMRGGPLMSALIGIAMQGVGRNGWWSNYGQLSAAECRSAITRLESIYAKRVEGDAILTEEKYCGQIRLPKDMKGLPWGIQILKNKTMGDYVRMMDAHIANTRKPYLFATPVQLPFNPLVKILSPIYDRSRWNFARNDAGNALWLVSLALRAYKLENGAYPPKLSTLVPRYLQAIPADPFGAGESLPYKKTCL